MGGAAPRGKRFRVAPIGPGTPAGAHSQQSQENAARTRIFLRPLATPLPLGFLGLFFATVIVAGLQLGWVPASQGRILAIGILVLTVPVQFIACIYGFLVRDLVAGTAMGLIGGTWATTAIVLLVSRPGSTSSGFAFLLVVSATALCIPCAAAGATKRLAAVVVLGTAARFAVTAVYEWGAPHVWETAAGGVGIALGVVALYAALAFELEDQKRHTVLPVWRLGAGKVAMTGDLEAQVAQVQNEAGVRAHL